MEFNPVYVNCVLLSEDFENLVFLYKTSGPQFLLNKYNFVGGKQKAGETTVEAISREIKEEAGINITSDLFYSCFYKEFSKDGKEYKFENFAAIVPNHILEKSYTAEKEEVFFRNTKDVLMDLFTNPQTYNHDFKDLLKNALSKTPDKYKNPALGYLENFISDRELKFSRIIAINKAIAQANQERNAHHDSSILLNSGLLKP